MSRVYAPGGRFPLIAAGACLVLGYAPALICDGAWWALDKLGALAMAVDDNLADLGPETEGEVPA